MSLTMTCRRPPRRRTAAMAPEHAHRTGRRLASGLIGLALCLASACTMEPRYHSPALPVPDQWPIPPTTTDSSDSGAAAAPAPDGQAASVRDIGWRDFFVDTNLQRLIATALANNRDLRVAVLNIERAR